MAREYSKTNVTIWQDDDWCDLPFPAQHVYRMLWDHPLLSYCGVVDWRPAKLSAWAKGLDKSLVTAMTDCLQARHFLVVDEATEECLVRSWVRFDGLIRQPRLAVSFANAYTAVASRTLRGVVIHEMKKLRDLEPDAQGWEKPTVAAMFDLPEISAKELPTPDDPFRDEFEFHLGSVSEPFGRNASSGLGSVSLPPTPAPTPAPINSTITTSAIAIADTSRADVEGICEHLAGRIEANTGKRPNISKRWRDAARLMLDADQIAATDVHAAIDWATNDGFWRANILSMPKLREKYEQLRLHAQRPGVMSKQQHTDDIFAKAAIRMGIAGGNK